MKEPKRVQKALDTLDTLLEWLHYYMGDCTEFRKFVRQEVTDLENLLRELSLDQKVHNIRLAKKLKAIWKLAEEEEKNEEK